MNLRQKIRILFRQTLDQEILQLSEINLQVHKTILLVPAKSKSKFFTHLNSSLK